MQIRAENFTLLNNVINQAKLIYILVGENPREDSLAAGLFLEENFTVMKKKVILVASGQTPENFRHLSAKIVKKIPVKKLVVSFNWRKNGVEKVSYNLEGENFNFIVIPKDKKINSEEISIYHSGDEPDLIITLGLSNLPQIENLEDKIIVNIDNKEKNQKFGSLNFVNPGTDSISAIVSYLVDKIGLPVKEKSEDFLMMGMRSATNNFNNVADPATFEAAAICTRFKEKGSRTQITKDETLENTDNLQPPRIFSAKQITN